MAEEETAQAAAGEDRPSPETEQSELLPFAHGTAATYTARCPVRETPNEDMGVVIPVDDNRAILAVADGMGGPPGGAHAAAIAIDTLIETVNRADVGEEVLRAVILNAFEAANLRVLEQGIGSGTTLAVVEIDGPAIRPYHAGDSEILVVGQRGKLKLQTVAHSPVGYAVQAGLLDAGEAIHHEDRHLVSNVVGSPDMWIEIGPTLTLGAKDTVVLGSDGLFDNLHLEEVIELARKGPLAESARKLAVLSRLRMINPEPGHPCKPDDLTFILYRRSC